MLIFAIILDKDEVAQVFVAVLVELTRFDLHQNMEIVGLNWGRGRLDVWD